MLRPKTGESQYLKQLGLQTKVMESKSWLSVGHLIMHCQDLVYSYTKIKPYSVYTILYRLSGLIVCPLTQLQDKNVNAYMCQNVNISNGIVKSFSVINYNTW